MLRAYVIHFKYQNPGDKAPGPVRQFRIYADSLDEARQLARQYANYPNIQILNIREA